MRDCCELDPMARQPMCLNEDSEQEKEIDTKRENWVELSD